MASNVQEKPSGQVNQTENTPYSSNSSTTTANSSQEFEHIKVEASTSKETSGFDGASDHEKGGPSRAQDDEDPDTDNDDDNNAGLADLNALYATQSWAEPTPPPDGGLRAWVQVSMGWIVIFSTWGYVNSFGAFQTHYTSILPESPSTISWIGSVQTWLTFVIGAFSGRALDAGYFLPTIMVGGVLQVVGIFTMSICTEYWQLMLTQGVVTGIGGGIIFTPCVALVATYFNKRRCIAIGLATTGNSIGGMIYPIVVRELLPKVGFGWTARVLGFINLAGFSLVFCFMRPRLSARKAGPVIDWTAFREPVYLTYVGGACFFVWSIYYTLYYIASFGTDTLGMSYSDATTLVTIVNGVGVPSRVLIPLLADRTGPINIIAPTAFCTAITAFTWLAVNDTTGYYIFTVFYGVITGAFQCLMPTGVTSITGRLDKVGTRLGMCFSILSFFGLTGPPVGGAIQATEMGYRAAQIWAACSMLLCSSLLFTTRFLKAGPKLKVKC